MAHWKHKIYATDSSATDLIATDPSATDLGKLVERDETDTWIPVTSKNWPNQLNELKLMGIKFQGYGRATDMWFSPPLGTSLNSLMCF